MGKSPRQKRFVIAVVVLVVLVGVISLPFLFPSYVFNHLFSRALRDAEKEGIFLRVVKLSVSSAEIDVRVPSSGLHLKQLKIDWRLKLFPPMLTFHWAHSPEDVAIMDIYLEKPKFNGRAAYSLAGTWTTHFDAQVESVIHDSKEVFPAFTLMGYTSGDNFSVKLRANYADRPTEVDLEGELKTLPSLSVSSKGKLTLAGVHWSGPLNIAQKEKTWQFRSLGGKLSLPPMDLLVNPPSGELDLNGELNSPRLKLAALLRVEAGGLKVPLNGTSDIHLEDEKGSVQVSADLILSPTFVPKTVFREPLSKFEKLMGRIPLVLNLKFSDDKSSLNYRVSSQGLTGYYDKIPFKGAKFDVAMSSGPKGMRGGKQTLSVAQLGKSLTLDDLQLNFNGPARGKWSVQTLNAKLAKGTLTAQPFSIDPVKGNFATQISVKAVDLEKIIAALDMESLSAKGTVEGEIPIRYRGRREYVSIRGAELHNVGGGIIVYKDQTVAGVKQQIVTLEDFNELMGQGQQALAFKALDNFHFTELRLLANRRRKTGLGLEIHLKGKNPDLAKGQLFELNLPITGKVEDLLVQTLLESLMEKQAWEDKIENAMERRR